MIGLVPLSVTTHELAHLGKLTFLCSQIYGNWERFYKEYKDFLEDYDHLVVKELIETKKIEVKQDDLQYLTYENTSEEDIEEESSELEDVFDDEDFEDLYLEG